MLRGRRVVPVTVFLVAWTLTTHPKYSSSGDEPHYLIAAESLIRDRDLDLRNDYREDRGKLVGHEHLSAGPHARPDRRGRLSPVHDVGVPLLVAPVLAIATGMASLVPAAWLQAAHTQAGLLTYGIVALFVIALAAAAAALTREALVAGGVGPGIATIVTLAVWLTPPVLGNAFGVYPEPFALLLTSWTLLVASRSRPPSAAQLLLLVAALGAMPWLHRKYLPYAVLLLVALVWRRRADRARVPAWLRAAALALFVAPMLALALWSQARWGTVAGGLMLERAPFSWAALRAGAIGLLLDREGGWLVWAPVLLLVPAGWALARRGSAAWFPPAAALFVLSAAHDQWWGGFSPAGRFLLPLAPFVALGAAAIASRPAVRPTLLALAVVQIAITACAWQSPRALWTMGDGHNRILGPLLARCGLSETLLPSLRAVPPQVMAGLVALAVVVAANGLCLWLLRTAPPVSGASGTPTAR